MNKKHESKSVDSKVTIERVAGRGTAVAPLNKKRKTVPIKIPIINPHSVHLIHDSDSETESISNSDQVNETVTCVGCRYNEPSQRSHMDKGGCLYMESESDSDTVEDPTLIDDQSISRETLSQRCQGCKDNQPNQLAHMDPGGCLYIEDDD